MQHGQVALTIRGSLHWMEITVFNNLGSRLHGTATPRKNWQPSKAILVCLLANDIRLGLCESRLLAVIISLGMVVGDCGWMSVH
eukprot:805517-Amphidinium_carterae.1